MTPLMKALRRRIDRIDLQILRLLNQRADLALHVGEVKKKHGRPVFDRRREAEVLRRIILAHGGPLPAGSVKQIFRDILRSTRRLQSSSEK